MPELCHGFGVIYYCRGAMFEARRSKSVDLVGSPICLDFCFEAQLVGLSLFTRVYGAVAVVIDRVTVIMSST